MANKRNQISTQIANLLRENLDGQSPFVSNLYDNVKDKQVFWDDITDYPTVCVYPGSETREYHPGDFKWAFVLINVRIYVQDENAKERLEEIFNDIETVMDSNSYLTVDGNPLCVDIRLQSITDDEGILHPQGVGEMTFEVRYEV
jgi:hypothetical protein